MKRSGEMPDWAPRFIEKVDIDLTGCWNWTAARDGEQYGRFKLEGRMLSAHRVAFGLFVGPVPDGLFVCHSCDNPPCCNPAHLFLGTVADNNRDCLEKQRNPTWRMTACRAGHEYRDGSYVWRKRAGGAFRRCLLCERPKRAKWMREQRRATA